MIATRSFFKQLRLDLLQFLAELAHDARQFLGLQQRQNRMAAANRRRAEVERAKRPRLREHLQQGGTERRRARVAALQPVETTLQLLLQARWVHAELMEDLRGIATARIQQLHQEMFDLDVVMRPSQAKTGGRFKRGASRVIQLANQTLQVHTHDRPLLATGHCHLPLLD